MQLLNNSSRGMSLLEVLLAVAVFAIGIGTVVHLYLGSQYASVHSVDKNQALIWAKEGIEAVRSIRDGDIEAFEQIVAFGGATIDKSTGEFSGYVWSDNVGWISFQESDVETVDCPDYPASCRAVLSNGDVSGWAVVLSNGEWISLRGTVGTEEYGVQIIDDKLHGWAWGDRTLGWISFNCENENECVASDYNTWIFEGDEGVNYHSIRGWAWSDNVGWIIFPYSTGGGMARGVIIENSKWILTEKRNTETKFTRLLSITEIDEDVWEVTVTVSWDTLRGEVNSVSLVERLTAWREPYLIEYDLTVSSTVGGLVTAPGEATYKYYYGNVVDIIAEADVGYIFTEWIGDIENVATPSSASTTITIHDDYSITATFGAE
jgi:prepilin-type N-terminal cleavage/methylation domain-containing protein